MKQIIGIILGIGAMILAYFGITTIANSGESVELLGMELSASDESQKTTGFIYLGLAVVALLGGVSLVKKS